MTTPNTEQPQKKQGWGLKKMATTALLTAAAVAVVIVTPKPLLLVAVRLGVMAGVFGGVVYGVVKGVGAIANLIMPSTDQKQGKAKSKTAPAQNDHQGAYPKADLKQEKAAGFNRRAQKAQTKSQTKSQAREYSDPLNPPPENIEKPQKRRFWQRSV